MTIYSPAITPDIHKMLLDRLHQQGVNTEDAPALLRDLSKILGSNLRIDAAMSNQKMPRQDGALFRLDFFEHLF
jgi:hypothetical protein